MAKSRTIKQGIYIRAPPRRVFRSLTEPRLLRKWFLASAKLSPRKDGNYEFAWHGGYKHSGKVLDYLRDQRLSLSWPGIMRGKLLGNTRVTFRLRPKNEGTFLEMTHTGFKAGNLWIELYGDISSGWAYFLTNLKSVVQHGRDLRSPEDKI